MEREPELSYDPNTPVGKQIGRDAALQSAIEKGNQEYTRRQSLTPEELAAENAADAASQEKSDQHYRDMLEEARRRG